MTEPSDFPLPEFNRLSNPSRTQVAPYYRLDRRDLYQFASSTGLILHDRVLNVGCAAGLDAVFLRGLGATFLVGVEPVEAAATEARSRYDQVFQSTLREYNWDGVQFEIIIFADVLEHLEEPYAALSRIHSWMESSGTLLISIPNVRHLSVIWQLVVKGDWKYTEAGIMDRTHLKFFTSKSLKRMLSETGFEIKEMRRWGAQPLARRLARLCPGLGEFLLSQIFVSAVPVGKV